MIALSERALCEALDIEQFLIENGLTISQAKKAELLDGREGRLLRIMYNMRNNPNVCLFPEQWARLNDRPTSGFSLANVPSDIVI